MGWFIFWFIRVSKVCDPRQSRGIKPSANSGNLPAGPDLITIITTRYCGNWEENSGIAVNHQARWPVVRASNTDRHRMLFSFDFQTRNNFPTCGALAVRGKTGKKAGNEILKCVLPPSAESRSLVIMSQIVWVIDSFRLRSSTPRPAPQLVLLVDCLFSAGRLLATDQ